MKFDDEDNILILLHVLSNMSKHFKDVLVFGKHHAIILNEIQI